LLERLELFRLEPRIVLDLGAGVGLAVRPLATVFPSAQIIALDTSRAMLERVEDLAATSRRIQADAEALPCRDQSVDLVFANMLLPWAHPQRVLRECARVLRPGGLALLTTLGPDTLRELRSAWSTVDGFIHVHGYIDMHDLGDLTARAGLVEPVVDVDRLTLRYRGAAAVVADLRAAGAANSAVGRRPGLTGRGRWAEFERALASRDDPGAVEVSVELVFIQAWAPDAGAGVPETAPDGVRVPLDAVTTRKR